MPDAGRASPVDPTRAPPAQSPRLWPIAILLVFATIAVYGDILGNGFVGLDDHATVYENWNLTHLSASSFFSFWTEPQRDLYAPLTYSVYAVIAVSARVHAPAGQVLAVPFRAWPFHVVSLLVHVLAVLVTFALLRRILNARWPAAAGALLFALHPVQVETVAWVTELNGLLCGSLTLGAVTLYLIALESNPRSSRGKFGLATEVFVLALLAKPLGVVAPMLALVTLWLVRDSLSPVTIRRGLWVAAIWFVLATPFAIIARLSQSVPAWWLTVSLPRRPLVAADALAFYGAKILWPATLTVDYGRSPSMIFANGAGAWTWLAPAIVAAGLVVLWRQNRARPIIAGGLWFIAALLPVLGLTPFAFQRLSTVADRYLYLPMAGAALAAAWGVQQIGDRSSRRGKWVLATGVVLVLTALGVRARLQCRVWRDKQSLFQHSVDTIGREPGTREGADVGEQATVVRRKS